MGGRIDAPRRYRAITRANVHETRAWGELSAEEREAIEVVSAVLPFKTNNYVVDELIDWRRAPDDPLFQLTFAQAGMLDPADYAEVAALLRGGDRAPLEAAIRAIRLRLNPHPGGQLSHNVPELGSRRLAGIQHKYRETVLFFPAAGQTCQAYCTFCFRWAQFVGMRELKLAARDTGELLPYLRSHREVSDLLITGGDPLVMATATLRRYVEPVLRARADLEHLRSIRIGTKSVAFWPHRFVSDADADELLRLFEEIVAAGLHLAVMAHYSHPRELSTPVARAAVARIRSTGAEIRMQSPLLRHINDDPAVWVDLWREGVALGCVPYYMFVERDTGAKDYFEVPLVRAWEVFRDAYSRVSGLARTVRGPSMSAFPGKVVIDGVAEVSGEKIFVLRFLQAREPSWVGLPFFAKFDPEATWLGDLRPAFGRERFFFAE